MISSPGDPNNEIIMKFVYVASNQYSDQTETYYDIHIYIYICIYIQHINNGGVLQLQTVHMYR